MCSKQYFITLTIAFKKKKIEMQTRSAQSVQWADVILIDFIIQRHTSVLKKAKF